MRITFDTPINFPDSGFVARLEFEVLAGDSRSQTTIGMGIGQHHIYSGSTLENIHHHKLDYLTVLIIFPFEATWIKPELSLDADSLSGNQQSTTISVGTEELVPIQIHGVGLKDISGLALQFRYPPNQLDSLAFTAGEILPTPQVIERGGNGELEIILISLGRASTVGSGLVGTIRLRTTRNLTAADLQLVKAELGRGEEQEGIQFDFPVKVTLKISQMVADFNGDRIVGFVDFLLFADRFGIRRGETGWDPMYDLDGNGEIGFGDFVILGQRFGR